MTALGRAAVDRRPHPGAWWCWALGAAAAVSATTNAVLTVAVVVAIGVVAVRRRDAEGSARTWWPYVVLGLSIVVIRLVFQAFLGIVRSGTVLFVLPEIPLPAWAQGVRLGGPVTVDGMAAALADALRLAALVACIGAAAVLATPRRLLRSVPSALGEATTAVAIALTVAPQLLDSVARVRRARRLRGAPRSRLSVIRTLVMPVLGDAVDRSVSLAAAMDSRGYGATLDARRVPAVTLGLMVGALACSGFGLFALLGLPEATAAGVACLLVGAAAAAASLVLAGRRLAVTRYRPQRWGRHDWAIAAAGLSACVVAGLARAASPAVMRPAAPLDHWSVPTALMAVIPVLLVSVLAWSTSSSVPSRSTSSTVPSWPTSSPSSASPSWVGRGPTAARAEPGAAKGAVTGEGS